MAAFFPSGCKSRSAAPRKISSSATGSTRQLRRTPASPAGCMVSDCIAKDKTLEELTLDEFKGYSSLFQQDIYDAIDLIKCCEGRTSYGGPSEASVKHQIQLAAAQLDAWEANNA